ncbi:unnamed protein product [Parajaminaea phylloscopi]
MERRRKGSGKSSQQSAQQSSAQRIVPGAGMRKRRRVEKTGSQRPGPSRKAPRTLPTLVEVDEAGASDSVPQDVVQEEETRVPSRAKASRARKTKPPSKAERARAVEEFSHLVKYGQKESKSVGMFSSLGSQQPLAEAIHWYAQDYYRAHGVLASPPPKKYTRKVSDEVRIPMTLQLCSGLSRPGPSKQVSQRDGEDDVMVQGALDGTDGKKSRGHPKATTKARGRYKPRKNKTFDMAEKLNISAMSAICAYVEFSVKELLGDHGQGKLAD